MMKSKSQLLEGTHRQTQTDTSGSNPPTFEASAPKRSRIEKRLAIPTDDSYYHSVGTLRKLRRRHGQRHGLRERGHTSTQKHIDTTNTHNSSARNASRHRAIRASRALRRSAEINSFHFLDR